MSASSGQTPARLCWPKGREFARPGTGFRGGGPDPDGGAARKKNFFHVVSRRGGSGGDFPPGQGGEKGEGVFVPPPGGFRGAPTRAMRLEKSIK